MFTTISKCMTLLPQPLNCQDYNCVAPSPGSSLHELLYKKNEYLKQKMKFPFSLYKELCIFKIYRNFWDIVV